MLSGVVPFVRRILVCFACSLVVGATASTALAAPAQSPPPIVVPPGDEVADLAQQYVGSPYRWGGASPSGFDCTGFVVWVYSQFGVALPHNEAGQLASGPAVDADDLQPGDVLVFATRTVADSAILAFTWATASSSTPRTSATA